MRAVAAWRAGRQSSVGGRAGRSRDVTRAAGRRHDRGGGQAPARAAPEARLAGAGLAALGRPAAARARAHEARPVAAQRRLRRLLPLHAAEPHPERHRDAPPASSAAEAAQRGVPAALEAAGDPAALYRRDRR